MAWDESKRPGRIRLWESVVFALFPSLIIAVVVGQVFGVSKYLLGVVFFLIPVDFFLCIVAWDAVRRR